MNDWDKYVASHPEWVRGLKLLIRLLVFLLHDVAPRVGAWIETRIRPLSLMPSEVAPRVGAWIETFYILYICFDIFVAPRVGAWIETVGSTVRCVNLLSRTPSGCVD